MDAMQERALEHIAKEALSSKPTGTGSAHSTPTADQRPNVRDRLARSANKQTNKQTNKPPCTRERQRADERVALRRLFFDEACVVPAVM